MTGHVAALWRFNPVLVPALVLFFWEAGARVCLLGGVRVTPPFQRAALTRWFPHFIVAYWILRNIPWVPFVLLATARG